MFFCSVSLAILLLVTSQTLAEEFSPNDAPSGKRAPMGFQGMRGKKDLTSSANEELAKRAPMGFQGMRGKKDSGADIEDNLIASDEELEKRSPMGFQGMRGKKDLPTPLFADSYDRDELFKRAPMGFQGMRGKKTMPDNDYYKTISMGFLGPQGEKSLDLLLSEIRNGRYGTSEGRNMYLMGYPGDYEKRARAMGFQGMRGKRQELEDGWQKRASMGFQGMRGKKSLLEAEMEDLEKRAIMGFQGMRGKKHIRSNYYDEHRPEQSAGYLDNAQISDHELEKRESATRKADGPTETRVKREAIGISNDYPTIWQYNMRDVADDDFFRTGLRHRTDIEPLLFDKRSSYGYLGMRGKKISKWGLRRKFVGVRGKKWSPAAINEDGNRLDSVYNNVEPGITVKTARSDDVAVPDEIYARYPVVLHSL